MKDCFNCALVLLLVCKIVNAGAVGLVSLSPPVADRPLIHCGSALSRALCTMCYCAGRSLTALLFPFLRLGNMYERQCRQVSSSEHLNFLAALYISHSAASYVVHRVCLSLRVLRCLFSDLDELQHIALATVHPW